MKPLAPFLIIAVISAGTAHTQQAQEDVSVSVTVEADQAYLSFKTITDLTLSLTAGEFSISPGAGGVIDMFGGGCLYTNFDALDITITHDNPYPEYATQGFRYFMSDPAKQTHLYYNFGLSFWGENGFESGVRTGGRSAPDSTGAPFTWRFNNKETGYNLRQTDADCTGLHYEFPSYLNPDWDNGPGNFFYGGGVYTQINGSPPAGWPDDAYPDLKSLIEALGPGDFTFTDTITLTFSPTLGS